jgi:hypothetical protein
MVRAPFSPIKIRLEKMECPGHLKNETAVNCILQGTRAKALRVSMLPLRPHLNRLMGLLSWHHTVQCTIFFSFFLFSCYIYCIHKIAGFTGYAGAYPAYPVGPPLTSTDSCSTQSISTNVDLIYMDVSKWFLGSVWLGCGCEKKLLWAVNCGKSCCGLWAVKKLKIVWWKPLKAVKSFLYTVSSESH